jgi:hypothetical protein
VLAAVVAVFLISVLGVVLAFRSLVDRITRDSDVA